MNNPFSAIALAVLGILAVVMMMNTVGSTPKQILGLSDFFPPVYVESAEGKNQTFGTLMSGFNLPSPTLTPPKK